MIHCLTLSTHPHFYKANSLLGIGVGAALAGAGYLAATALKCSAIASSVFFSLPFILSSFIALGVSSKRNLLSVKQIHTLAASTTLLIYSAFIITGLSLGILSIPAAATVAAMGFTLAAYYRFNYLAVGFRPIDTLSTKI